MAVERSLKIEGFFRQQGRHFFRDVGLKNNSFRIILNSSIFIVKWWFSLLIISHSS
jgi:hypothetical protein